jgi:DNA-binding response OmpR family regulator
VIATAPVTAALDQVLGAVQHDIVSVASVALGYSHIKRVRPDLVILCLSDDDLAGCQLLSMLALDAATSGIPVLTCMTATADDSSFCDPDPRACAFSHAIAGSLN